ncbi:MAG: IS200/IS605 family transposase [Tenuifilaceae bacterium]
MPFIKIWIHAVWSTYKRQPFLKKEIRSDLFLHINENAKKKGIHLDHINGYVDHVHCLISLDQDQNIATIMQLIKGESSFWLNRNSLTSSKFGWQEEYFAVSVGESQIERVRKYIQNQEAHHSKVTFQDEYIKFIETYGFEETKGLKP